MSKKLFGLAAIAAVVLLGLAGCKGDDLKEDLSGVDPAYSDPSGRGTEVDNIGGGGSIGEWGDTDKLNSNADPQGWREADPTGNRLNMPIIYFAYDSDALVPSETANLDRIAEYLAGKPKLALVIEGHCDQRGTDEYNRALSERRANAIRAYLAGRGVEDFRMRTKPCGKDQPAVEGSGESIWRQNRRGVPVPMIMP